jgi:hypothetical protein
LPFSGVQKEKLKRPRPIKPLEAQVSDDVSSWQFDTTLQQTESDSYLMSMMPHAFEGDYAVAYGSASGAASGAAFEGASGAASEAASGAAYASAFASGGYCDSSGGYFGASSEHAHFGASKKPRPKSIKKPRKDEDNLLKQAFDVILETSPAVEIPSVYPVLPTPFFGMSADDTYKHFPSGMPYVRETVRQAILNKKFKIAKPGGGASAGGNVREIGPKISWLQRDLEVCALLGFCAHDVYELYLESDEQARQREGSSSRGVCFVFKK